MNSPKEEEVAPEISFTLSEYISQELGEDAEEKINRYLTWGFILLTGLILINIFIICLLFKTKWNKIIKYGMLVVFGLFLLAALIAFILGVVYMAKLRSVLKLYLLFK